MPRFELLARTAPVRQTSRWSLGSLVSHCLLLAAILAWGWLLSLYWLRSLG